MVSYMICTSYVDDLIGRASPLSIKGSDLCLSVVSMHCFTIVEVHCPNWVMCEFGLHQHIPDDVNTLNDLLVVKYRGKEENDYSMVHA